MSTHKKISLSVAAARAIDDLKQKRKEINKKIKELQNGTNQGK